MCRTKDNPLAHSPSRCRARPWWRGRWHWRLAASLPSSFRVSGGSAPLPCYYRWQVRLCLWQKGHKFYQFSWVPSATRPLHVGWGRRPGLLPGVPPEAGRRGVRGQEPAGLDEPRWRGQDELPWKTGTAGGWGVRGAGAGSPVRAAVGLDRPDALCVASHPFSRCNRVSKAAVAAVLTGTSTAGICTAGISTARPRP